MRDISSPPMRHTKKTTNPKDKGKKGNVLTRSMNKLKEEQRELKYKMKHRGEWFCKIMVATKNPRKYLWDKSMPNYEISKKTKDEA